MNGGAVAGGGAAAMPLPPVAVVGPAVHAAGSLAIHTELAGILNGASIQTTLGAYTPAVANQRVTVIITFPKSTLATLGGHPGHVGVALWNTTNTQYTSTGINLAGVFGTEDFTRAEVQVDNRYELWYFTKAVTGANATAMRTRMVNLAAAPQGYGMVIASRFVGYYNCVTAADTILYAGGESWGLASSTSTPYGYSCSFGNGWTQSRIDNARHA